jgi:HK97 family phage major capsid protein
VKPELKNAIAEVVTEEVHKGLKEISEQFKERQITEATDPKNKTKAALLKSGTFLKALISGDETVLKDLSEGVDANGGYLVPTEFYGQIVERRQKRAYLRRFATVIPMGSDKMDIPTDGNDVSVNWVAELATITQSDPTFGQKTLSVNLLAGLSRMSRQLIQDAAVNEGIAELVIRKFANKIARVEDTVFMTGADTTQPRGLRSETVTSVAQAGASLAANDIIELYHAVPQQYRDDAIFIMPDSRLKLVRQLRSTDGYPIYESAFRTGEELPTLLGRPVVTNDDIPTNLGAGTNESEIWFGDFSYYYVGDREQIGAETSTQEGTSFEKHRAAVKVWERIDGRAVITEAFAKLTAVK